MHIKKILIAEDDSVLAQSLHDMFMSLHVSCHVDIAHSYESAFELLMNRSYDLLLVDIYFKGSQFTGLDLCRNIRQFSKKVPVIVVTSSSSIDDMDIAFSHQIQDYIHKPFDARQLMIRAKRWLLHSEKDLLEYGDLVYDLKNNRCMLNGVLLDLSPKLKQILLEFMQQPETLITSEHLLEKVWGDYYFRSRNLRSYIHSLRDSLGPKHKDCIQTVRGEGYVLTMKS